MVPARPTASTLRGMFNVGGGELLVILLVALIVLGPQRLPGAARQVGRVMGDIRRLSTNFQQELKDAFDDDSTPRRGPVPLPRAVADAEAATRTGDDARPPAGPPTLRRLDAPAGGAASVAPAVSDALDEIVAPVPPPEAAPAEGPEPGGERRAGDEGLGGERAAS